MRRLCSVFQGTMGRGKRWITVRRERTRGALLPAATAKARQTMKDGNYFMKRQRMFGNQRHSLPRPMGQTGYRDMREGLGPPTQWGSPLEELIDDF